MTKRLSKVLMLVLVGTLLLTACGKKKDSAEESKEEVEDVLEDVEKVGENEEEEPKLTEEDIKAQEEKSEQIDTYVRAVELVENIIGDFKDVKLEDERIQLTDDNKSIYTADIYLYLDNDNKDEALKLIDKYSEEFEKKFTAKEKYEELIIYWLTPNHTKSEAIEKIYY